jgi:glutamate/tyrosine decarboxylase-like PLP-dependent enzyme
MSGANVIGGRRNEIAQAVADAPERSLDPTDWAAFRKLAHATLDDAIDFVATARERPVWRPIPDDVKAVFADGALPIRPSNPEALVAEINRSVLAYACGNTHPRFFGWVHGTGTAGGVLAEMMAAAVNANLGGRDHAAVYVERQVIDWCRQIFGLPEGAGGLLVSGTSMATVVALTVARNDAAARLGAGVDVRRHGMQALGGRLVAYTSAEAHGSVAKALELLGVGREWVRAIPTDAAFRIDCNALAHAVAADRAAGHHPFAVIGTAGTVNTGALDPLEAIADICAEEALWLHVDGAFGGLGVLSPEIKPLLKGIERADSIAFDFHKWLHVPYDAGCVLVRRGELQSQAFGQRAAYLAGSERGLAAGEPWFCEMGPELSRGFRALKVWFTLKEHGLDQLGAKISDNCRQARYLARRISKLGGFELSALVSLNIVCFRVVAPNVSLEALDRLNGDIVVELQERGIAAPSMTRLNGRVVIRVNITNHRTTLDDIDMLVDAVRELAMDRLFEATAAQAGAPSRISPAVSTKIDIDDDRRYRRLTAVLARPEIAPVAAGVEVTLASYLEQPFIVDRHGGVIIDGNVLDTPDGAAVIVRHALELAVWTRVIGDKTGLPGWAAAVSLLSARCAALYLAAFPDWARNAACSALPEYLRAIYDRLAALREWTDLRELLMPGASRITELLPLMAGGPVHAPAIAVASAVKADAGDLVLRLAAFAVPTEVLLAQGGDSRVAQLPATGRNAYGTATAPQPGEICFSSSTATNVSQGGYAAVEVLRQRLMAEAVAGQADAVFKRQMSAVRRKVAQFTGAAQVAGSAVVLTASGTDTELLALDFARFGGGKASPALVSIVVDPNETGTGVPFAAGGRHYLTCTSQGLTVDAGSGIDGLADGRIEVHFVGLRHADGAPRAVGDIDAEVERVALRAIAEGRRCLLHVLDASKTGLGAPSIALATRLMDSHPDAIDVVVDACQMRLSSEAMRAYLERGFMVQVTASKFYAAPPFAGALLLPRTIVRRPRGPLPMGLAAYVGRAEWPTDLGRRLHVPTGRSNLGLLARWTAGLHEIEAFEAVPEPEARALLVRFQRDVASLIAERPTLRLAGAHTFDHSVLGIDDQWAGLATILSFEVMRRGTDGHLETLGFDELRQVYRLIGKDLAARLPRNVRRHQAYQAAARFSCHVGQPVRTGTRDGQPQGVLRICSSARHVIDVYGSDGDVSAREQRYVALLEQVAVVLDKIELVTVHLDAFG